MKTKKSEKKVPGTVTLYRTDFRNEEVWTELLEVLGVDLDSAFVDVTLAEY